MIQYTDAHTYLHAKEIIAAIPNLSADSKSAFTSACAQIFHTSPTKVTIGYGADPHEGDAIVLKVIT